MPGGFTSSGDRDGYQSVEEADVTTPRTSTAAPPQNSAPQAPGAYQSV